MKNNNKNLKKTILNSINTNLFEFEENMNNLKKIFDSIFDLSSIKKWLNTISFALLGYFLTIMFQIKLKEIVPFKVNAFGGILLLFISLCIGFYIRIRTELENRALKIPDMVAYLNNLQANCISINNEIEEL